MLSSRFDSRLARRRDQVASLRERRGFIPLGSASTATTAAAVSSRRGAPRPTTNEPYSPNPANSSRTESKESAPRSLARSVYRAVALWFLPPLSPFLRLSLEPYIPSSISPSYSSSVCTPFVRSSLPPPSPPPTVYLTSVRNREISEGERGSFSVEFSQSGSSVCSNACAKKGEKRRRRK